MHGPPMVQCGLVKSLLQRDLSICLSHSFNCASSKEKKRITLETEWKKNPVSRLFYKICNFLKTNCPCEINKNFLSVSCQWLVKSSPLWGDVDCFSISDQTQVRCRERKKYDYESAPTCDPRDIDPTSVTNER